MKITKVSKSLTYYITTDDPEFPDYRTDDNGENWENYLGGIWNPVFDYVRIKELQELFREWKKKLIEGRYIKKDIMII